MKRAFLFWEAQAATLHELVACRRARLGEAIACEEHIGRLPMWAGWQPALPRIER